MKNLNSLKSVLGALQKRLNVQVVTINRPAPTSNWKDTINAQLAKRNG